MCGISGFIDNKLNYDQTDVLNKMTNSLNHRGPDSQNQWKSVNNKISVGHSRLSIRDLSQRSNQPILSDNGRYVLSYNGEIYNTEYIKNFLKKNFLYTFQDNNISDTIILLKLIELNGLENSLMLLNGMFAFFLLDQKKKKCILSKR